MKTDELAQLTFRRSTLPEEFDIEFTLVALQKFMRPLSYQTPACLTLLACFIGRQFDTDIEIGIDIDTDIGNRRLHI